MRILIEAFVDLLPIINRCIVEESGPSGTYICCAERRPQSKFLEFVEEPTQWCLDLRDDGYEISVFVNELLFLVIYSPFPCIIEPTFDVGYLKFSGLGASLYLRMIEQKSFFFKSIWKPLLQSASC